MQDTKTFYLYVNGERIEVSEEIYRAYKQPLRAEQSRKRREWRCRLVIKTKSGNHYKRCDGNCSECKNVANGSVLSLDALEEENSDVLDRGQDLEANIIDKEDTAALYEAITQLKEKDRLIVEMLLNGKSQVEISKHIGIAKSTVSEKIKIICGKLKKFLERNL